MTDEKLEKDQNEELQEAAEEVITCDEEVCSGEEIEEAETPQAAEDSEAETVEAAGPGDKKGLFGKKKEKKKDKKDQQIEELTDRLKRQMAEFDNFRKRTEKEKAAMYEIGAKGVIEKILPVIDNFERGLAAVPEEQKEDPFVDGMDKIYKQMLAMMDELGVKVIEAVGEEFNPELHNAVMHIDDDESGENVIVEEFQKGYTYKDSVVRHSMVKVAN